jgi:predicted nucleic acid-binding protein
MFLADTNVLSELVRARPDGNVLAWAELQPMLALSVVTLEEIAFGFALRPNPGVEARLSAFIDQNCEVIDVDASIARRAGELRGRFARAGDTRMQADMLIAATAQLRKLVLATRNVSDFTGCGVRLANPFEP